MELRDYLRILRKRGWIILLTTLLTAAAAWGFSQVQTVEYKSSISVFVRPGAHRQRHAAGDQADSARLCGLHQQPQLRAAGDYDAGLDMLPDTLKGKVTIASKDEDYIIQIDVVDTDAAQSERIALEWANQFVQWRNQDNLKQRKEDRVDADIVQNPDDEQVPPADHVECRGGRDHRLAAGRGHRLLSRSDRVQHPAFAGRCRTRAGHHRHRRDSGRGRRSRAFAQEEDQLTSNA